MQREEKFEVLRGGIRTVVLQCRGAAPQTARPPWPPYLDFPLCFVGACNVTEFLIHRYLKQSMFSFNVGPHLCDLFYLLVCIIIFDIDIFDKI